MIRATERSALACVFMVSLIKIPRDRSGRLLCAEALTARIIFAFVKATASLVNPVNSIQGKLSSISFFFSPPHVPFRPVPQLLRYVVSPAARLFSIFRDLSRSARCFTEGIIIDALQTF